MYSAKSKISKKRKKYNFIQSNEIEEENSSLFSLIEMKQTLIFSFLFIQCI